MRKNRSKHEAKKPRLAKRALALCFALIFVCSCLLPAFAYGDVATFEADDGEALLDGGFAVDDSYGVDVQDETTDASTDTATTQPGGISTGVGGGINMGGSVVIGGDDSTTDSTDTSKKPTVTKTEYGTVITWDVDDIEMPEDLVVSRPDEDHALDKVDAAFSLPTNIYHFWLKEMSSYDLADISTDAKAADMTVEQYLAMYGKDKGCYHIMTAADGADLNAYKFSNPTSLDDADGRTFAGWYTIDEFHEKHDFTFDQTLYITSGTTVEVFAKWITPVEKTTNINAESVTVTVDGVADAAELDVAQSENESFYDEIYNDLADDLSVDEDGNSKYKSIDVHMFNVTPLDKNLNKVQPASGKKATVTIEGMSLTSDEFKVYHWKDGEIEDLTSTAKLENGTLTFKTTSFSDFAVVALGASASTLEENYPQTVYLFVKVTGDTSGLYGHINDSGSWYTIGSLADVSLPNADTRKWNNQKELYYTSNDTQRLNTVVEYLKANPSKLERNGRDDYTEPRLDKLSSEIVKGNSGIDLSKVTWKSCQAGWGAECYVNGEERGTWHLDGEISVQYMEGYSINYYLEGTTTKLRDSEQHDATVGTVIDLSKAPYSDYYLEEIEKDGVKYKLVHKDPTNCKITVEKDKKEQNVINLYYEQETLDITITKKVDNGDKTKDFKFKVTSNDFSTTSNVSLTNRDGGSQKPQEWFYLKDDQSATLKGLKKGYIFTIEEEKENSIDYDTTATENIEVEAGKTKSFCYRVVEEDGKLALQPIAEKGNTALPGKLVITDGKVVVTNNAAATHLTVTKTVRDGNATAPEDAEFTFQLTVTNEAKVYQKVKLTKKNNDVTESSVVSSHKNQWQFKLKNNESIDISGIRIDDNNVKVEELINDSHYTTTYKVDNGTSENGTSVAIPVTTLTANQNTGTVIEFTNTYNIPKLNSMTITKNVTGEFGEREKDFTFSVTLKNKDDETVDVTGVNHTGAATNLNSFNLKHGQTVTLNQIPVGTIITITETNADGYKTSATKSSTTYGESYTDDRTFVYEVVEHNGEATLMTKATVFGVFETEKAVPDNAIVVTNEKKGDPDTGVLLDTLPYLIILGIAVAGAAALLIRKKKHDDE